MIACFLPLFGRWAIRLAGAVPALALLLVGTVAAAQAPGDFLEVSVRVFEDWPAADALLPADTYAVQPAATPSNSVPPVPTRIAAPPSDVRLAEYRYLPMYLRYRLEAMQRFGAVRVLPLLDNGAQLSIEGWIVASDGATLELQVMARDSTGRVWLNRRYSGSANPAVSISEDPLAQDDFAGLFGEVLRDLLAVLDTLTAEQLAEIHQVALLRYGAALVPQSFSGYLREEADGRVSIARLPASNDPLLSRIETIREHEYLFIDVVDEEYQRFFNELRPVYGMWRQSQREQARSSDSFISRQAGTASGYRPGSYYDLQESYNNYRWAKVQELYQDELSEGFANEVAPTELALENSLYRLTGTLEQQYREWRGILAELFELEGR